jgi:hypothetical protein
MKPPGLELVRLDDRIAPGSVWATAAVQVVALNGPFAWIGLDEPALSALGPASDVASSSPDQTADGAIADLPVDRPLLFFSLTSPPADTGSLSADHVDELASIAPSGWRQDAFAEMNEPAASGVSALPVAAITVPPHGDGGGVFVSAPAIHTGAGVAASGGMPTQPPADTASPKTETPTAAHAAHSTSTATPTAAIATNAIPATTPAHAPHVPSGHFASQLQALMNLSGSSAGTLDLSGAADQQGQIGGLVGSQLSHATLLGGSSASAAAHRPASLLGQTLNGGTDPNLGLRTTPSSSGPFQMVGTHSVGDLLAGPGAGAGHAGALMSAPDTIARTIPSGSLPQLGASGAAFGGAMAGEGDRPAPPGLDDFSTATVTSLGDGLMMRHNSTLAAPAQGFTFQLDAVGPPVDDKGNTAFTLSESGTIDFAWIDGYQDYGVGYMIAELDGSATIVRPDGSNGGAGLYEFQWTGYATPTGLLFGFDIDQFNQQYFGIDATTALSYVLDSTGHDSRAPSNDPTIPNQSTTTTTTHNGTVTRHESDTITNPSTVEDFTLHAEGPGSARQLTWDDTANTSYTGSVTGTDTDSADPLQAHVANDSYGSTNTSTHSETDHTEGTVGADGTFTLKSFSIDETDDSDYSDSVSGSESQPEPGGGESDSFTENDSGHDHDHLHAEGTVDNWTASLDDTDNSSFNDGDNGSESSSQMANGTSDSTSDTFGSSDGGTFSDVFNLAGTGTATAFIATSVGATIEDTYQFSDHDQGHATDSQSGESDAGDANSTDHGDATERLSVTGDADSLSAHYTDTAHDWFTDSDSGDQNWSQSDSNGSDTGHDHSTDGKGGNETVGMSADATMDGWQSDDPQHPPQWQAGALGADITGSDNVHFGDDGSDTVVQTANAADSDSDHFVDSATGSDSFTITLTGNGASATLTPTVTRNLTTHAVDDNNANWNDQEKVANEDGVDSGSEGTHGVDDDTGYETVSETETLNPDGTITPGAVAVDVSDDGRTQDTESGSDRLSAGDAVLSNSDNPETSNGNGGTDDAAVLPGVHDLETVNDTADLREHTQIHTGPADGGGTIVDVDQRLTQGTISLGGSENDSQFTDPRFTDTDNGGGNLSGSVTGDIHQSGVFAAGVAHLLPANGSLSADMTGHGNDANVEVIDASDGTSVPMPNVVSVAQFQADPGVDDIGAVSTGPFLHAHVAIIRTVNAPNAHVTEDVSDTAGVWSVANFSSSGRVTTGAIYAGHYDYSPNRLIDPWAGGTVDRTMTLTDWDDELAQGSAAAGATGDETIGHGMSLADDESWTNGTNLPVPAVGHSTVHYEVGLTTSDETKGGTHGPASEEITENGTENGSTHLWGSADDGSSSDQHSTVAETHYFNQKGNGPPDHMVLTDVTGTDTRILNQDWTGDSPTTSSEGWSVNSQGRSRTLGGDGQIVDYESQTFHAWGDDTDLASGQQTTWDKQTSEHPPPKTGPGVFANVAGAIGDFAAGIGDAAVGAVQWLGDTAYALAHKGVQPIYMGADLLQAAYVGVQGAITGNYVEPNWLSDAARNAPADPNDREAYGRYIVNLELENLKDGAIAVGTLGAGKAIAPVLGRVAGKLPSNTGKTLASAAKRAAAKVGPGRGGAHGTRVHTAFKAEVGALGQSSLRSEVSFLNGIEVRYGMKGSVRLDVVELVGNKIKAVYDLKTGSAALTMQRIQQILSHLPPGSQGVPVIQIRP